MPKYDFPLQVITQELDDGTFLAEALFFPGVSRFGSDPARLERALGEQVRDIIENDLTPIEIHRRSTCLDLRVEAITVVVDPPTRSRAWKTPCTLRVPVLTWTHGADAYLAYVPALRIEVLAGSAADRAAMLPRHILAALARREASASLLGLSALQRCHKATVTRITVQAVIKSPSESAQAGVEQHAAAEQAFLQQVCTDLTAEPGGETYENDDTVATLAQALAGRERRSVLLVGPSGVGKTAAVRELVRRRHSLPGLDATPFWGTSGSKLVAGMCGFGEWEQRCKEFCALAAKRKAILHLGNLLELFEVGKSEHQRQSIAMFLQPYIARGEILAIAECTPEQRAPLEREDERLLQAFRHITLREPSVEQGRAILLGWALAGGGEAADWIDLEAIDTVDRLHRRYATYSAYPGRPLRFMAKLRRQAHTKGAIGARDATAAFSRETGLPLFMLDPSVPLDLAATHRWFSERVMGQEEAVTLVVDLLATTKVALGRPRRPLASFLFMGSTGVGKTEMAKSLAEFLFGDKSRMVRFDMSEFAEPASIARLIGTSLGHAGLLTSKLRDQPFSVVLFDEFEKAHPAFNDLLLQVLGEGRLTDAAGRVADFCNAVVILTSNLGGESFKAAALGYSRSGATTPDAREHFLAAVREFVRPELFNRIDRLVPFLLLDSAMVRRIARRELDLVRRRDGLMVRGARLTVPDDVIDHLAAQGFVPQYGARPLKRAIETRLLVPLAEALNDYAATTAVDASCALKDGEIRITAAARGDAGERHAPAGDADPSVHSIAEECADLRRNAQLLATCPSMYEVQEKILQLRRLSQMVTRKGDRAYLEPEQEAALARLPLYEEAAARHGTMLEAAHALETRALLACYGYETAGTDDLRASLEGRQREHSTLLTALYALQFAHPHALTMGIYGRNKACLYELARMYAAMAAELAYGISLYKVVPFGAAAAGPPKPVPLGAPPDETPELVGISIPLPDKFLEAEAETPFGFLMEIRGENCLLLLKDEVGVHVLHAKDAADECLVHVSDATIAKYVPPEGITRRGAIGRQGKRRVYNLRRRTAEDLVLRITVSWTGGGFVPAIAALLHENLMRAVEAQVDDER